MFKKFRNGFTLVGLILAGCIWALASYDVELGIDLRGGTELTYTLDLSELPGDRRATAAEEVKTRLLNRFDEFGLKDLLIAVSGKDTLVIQIPAADDNDQVEDIKNRIQTAGKMTIFLQAEVPPGDYDARVAEVEQTWDDYSVVNKQREDEREQLVREGKTQEARDLERVSEPESKVVQRPDQGAKIVVENTPGSFVPGSRLSNAYPTIDDSKGGIPAVGFEFDAVGASMFGELTSAKNRGRSLVIVLDNTVVSIATINDRISNRGIISGSMEQEEVVDLVTILKAGSLPLKPELDSESRIGALLGQESIERGTVSMAIGFLFVLVFMIVYYKVGLGTVAAVSLLFNLTLVLALLVVFRNALTLPGLAGFLLTVGMAVDANILIYERIREERKRGRGLSQAITNGYGKAFSTILDANLTTLITAFILFQFGTGPVKGFAVVLAIGIITSFFTSLYVSRLVISALVKWGLITDAKMLTLIEDPSFDFLAYRGITKKISIAVLAVGFACLLFRGPESLGLDFTGGTRVLINLEEPMAEQEMRQLLEDSLGKAPKIQARRQVEGGFSQFSVETREVEERKDGETIEEARSHSFKAKVEKAVGDRAAPSLLKVTSPDANTFSATVFVRPYDESSERPVTPDELRDAFGASDDAIEYEVSLASVETAPAVGIWSALAVSIPVTAPATHNQVEREVRDRLDRAQKNQKLYLANAFPEVSSIGGRVARDLQSKVFVAMMLAFAAIVFYVSLRFQLKFGLAAIVALVHDVTITLGMLAIGDLILGNFLNLKIDLPVVAALLTVVGYSLNDTIVIFDRIRENLDGRTRNVNWPELVNQSINQALSRTLLTSVTTFLVVVILLVWGGEALQGFAYALAVGVFVGTYSSVYVASPALLYFHRRSEERRAAVLAEAATSNG